MFGSSPVPGASTPWTVVQPAPTVRTVEGLNIMFDDPRMAGGVVGLLNVMYSAPKMHATELNMSTLSTSMRK